VSKSSKGRCEIPAPRSSMVLSVRFGTNSALTPLRREHFKAGARKSRGVGFTSRCGSG
jgi:hypothetical protein